MISQQKDNLKGEILTITQIPFFLLNKIMKYYQSSRFDHVDNLESLVNRIKYDSVGFKWLKHTKVNP